MAVKNILNYFLTTIQFKELNPKTLTAVDPLKFEDTKKYPDRLKAAKEKTNLTDAVRTAVGKSFGKRFSNCRYGFCISLEVQWDLLLEKKLPEQLIYSIENKIPFFI